MPAPILLGESNFIPLRRAGKLYVDKSMFVREVIEAHAVAMLFPRPRRFGKTLNLSMLQAFFEIGPDRSALFEDLAIWTDPVSRPHFQAHPVIKVTFKDVKDRTWAGAEIAIKGVLAAEVDRHHAAVTDDRVPSGVRERLAAVLHQKGDPKRTLLDLSHALAIHHSSVDAAGATVHAGVVLLIDEYDAGILEAWEHGYYDAAVSFFKSLLSPGLKDNPYLFKGVLTGILRVSRESMFSDLNNLIVYSLLATGRPENYGFTEPEVLALLEAFGRSAEADEVRHWYNGYRFGGTTVYNPWSILTMLAQPGQPLAPHWLNTSANGLVRSLLLQSPDLGPDVETLLGGGSIETRIEENVPLRALAGHHVWGLLLFSGYLKPNRVWVDQGETFATLSIPNAEVRLVWRDTFRSWLEDHTRGLSPLPGAILAGDAPTIERILTHMLLTHASSHDVSTDQDEAFYHAFVLGLLVTLERTHTVRSNRETGDGRADLLITPRQPGLPGVILEFKRRRGKTPLATSARAALKQIQDRQYAVELESAGANPIHRLGIAFGGKDVAVRGGRGKSAAR